MSSPFRLGPIALASVLALAGYAAFGRTDPAIGRIGAGPAETRGITTTGMGTELGAADLVLVPFTIEASHLIEPLAQTDLMSKRLKAHDAIKATGLDVTKIVESEVRVTVNPADGAHVATQTLIVWMKVPAPITGAALLDLGTANAIAQVRVKTAALEKAISGADGKLMPLRFAAEDGTVLGNKVRQAAVEDAKAKAEVYARHIGARLGPVAGITERHVEVASDEHLSGAMSAKAEVVVTWDIER